MKKLLLIASFLCTVFMVSAQQVSVQGMITDSSGSPVANAQVIIIDASTGNALGWSQSLSSGTYFWLDTVNAINIGQPGVLVVSVIDCNGNGITQTLSYTPNQLNLTANFTGVCGSGSGGVSCGVYIPLPFVGNGSISITANGTGGIAPYTYLWDMGDGTTQTTQTANHTYAANGTYTVCVTIIDATGCVATQCMPVTITGATGGNNCSVSMVTYPDTTNYLIHDFYAQVGSGTVLPVTYLWDFGDGNTSTVATPSHTYSMAGTYHACVTVTDANGCVAMDCYNIHVVQSQNCNISFTAAPFVANPNAYSFTPSVINGSMIYLWDFGDGGFDTTNISPTYTYAQPGTYLVCLYGIDFLTGCVSNYCDTIVVGTPAPCQASIQYMNVPGSLSVDFFGSSTGTAPFTYSWDFGDGNSSTVQNPTHLYSTIATGPVNFNVTLTVIDAAGCVSVATETVTIFGGSTNGQITGYLWKDTFNFIPADGLVYLIEYDSINGSLTAIDTVQTQQGLFNFMNVPAGDYLVKAALLPTDVDYANYLPTYFVQSLSWNNAQYIGPAPFGIVFMDIQLVAGNNPGGAGFIGGLVVNGAGRPVNGNQTLIENINNMEPIEGASVLLLDANGNAVTHTTTDETGAYSFNGIAMGTYNVHVEEIGKVTFPANIVVDANNMNHTEVHFTVHESMVTLTAVYEVSNIEGLNVFPNPVNDAATIQIELAEAMDFTLTVTNLMGQEVINTNKSLFAGENTFSVEMTNLPTGLYLMSLKSGSDVVTYKIQKN